MCGIAGIISTTLSERLLQETSQAMADRIAHRGPDDSGVWCDAPNGIALSHRRLSIIDLSQHGHQPMVSASGRYVICYNGEIYNFRELRATLDYPFRGDSDTEVLLALIEAEGLNSALKKSHGMFAFALWDREEKKLYLARDRMGEKPLYYGQASGHFLFASELKAMQAVPDFSPAINRKVLADYVRFSYVPAPHSIYESIHKLTPGCWACYTPETGEVVTQVYWSLEQVAREGAANRLVGSEQAITDQLEAVLKKAVAQAMVSDVPLGAFLSGGIDSSTIVALMQAQSSRPVQTFSIGFHEAGFDEAPYAKSIAKHLGTDHAELYVTPQQALDVIPGLPTLYDEPFADSSQIPTFLVSQLARRHVTVSLSGDGGDEFFGGYNRYLKGPKLWRIVSLLPPSLRRGVIKSLLFPAACAVNDMLPMRVFLLMKIRNYLLKLQAADAAEFYVQLSSAVAYPDQLLAEPVSGTPGMPYDPAFSFAEWMMLQDGLTYLPGDILVKVDRAAMGVSLETRIPFFDPHVMALAWRLPESMKIRGGQGKYALRQVLARHVPTELFERPKAGFCIPLAQWLTGPLREWGEALLDESLLHEQGYWNVKTVRRLWARHQSGSEDNQMVLWNLLMFQSWLQHRFD